MKESVPCIKEAQFVLNGMQNTNYPKSPIYIYIDTLKRQFSKLE